MDFDHIRPADDISLFVWSPTRSKNKKNQQIPIDLVADFYIKEKLDLNLIVRAKKASIQSVINYSLAHFSEIFLRVKTIYIVFFITIFP